MEWMIVALLLNSGGGIGGSFETKIQFANADECIENLAPTSNKFSAVAEKALRKSGRVSRGDKAPRIYKNVEWVCFPVSSQGSQK